MQEYTISFTKTFISGNLRGISVPIVITMPEDSVAIFETGLRHIKASYGTDVFTSDRFIISNVVVSLTPTEKLGLE